MRTVLSIMIWIYWAVCIILYFFIIAFLFLVTFPFDRYRQIPNKVLGGLARMMLKVNPGWCFSFSGVDPVKLDHPTIVVANHQSFLDMPLIFHLPWKMKWVSKKSLFRIPVLGWIIFMTGHLGIDRESRRSFKKLDALVEPIQNGIPGMIFPEGTRTQTGDLKSFKNGAFFLSKRYNFNVLPIVLDGGYRAMPTGTWRLGLDVTFKVSVLNPLGPDAFDSVVAMRQRTYTLIKEELARMRADDTCS